MNEPDIESMAGLPADASDILTPAEHARLCKCYRLADDKGGEQTTEGQK